MLTRSVRSRGISGSKAFRHRENRADHLQVLAPCDEIEGLLVAEVGVRAAYPEPCRFGSQVPAEQVNDSLDLDDLPDRARSGVGAGNSSGEVKEFGELIDDGEAALVIGGESKLQAALDKADLKAEKHAAKELGVSSKGIDKAAQEAAKDVS